jgi:hypothetical protein
VASFKAGDKGGGEAVSVEKTGYVLVVQSDRNFNYYFSLFRTGDVSEAEARLVILWLISLCNASFLQV